MIYLDNGATSLPKPPQVARAVAHAVAAYGNPGRGGHRAAREAARTVFHCREMASKLFDCQPEQVVFTANCTQGLNMALRTLLRRGDRVVISGFEHNAVTRPLYALGAKIVVAGRRLFDWENTLEEFEKALRAGADAAVFTHVSNVFGYILPAEQMAALCRQYGVPFVVDAAQSAGTLPVKLGQWGADFVAMPGHKGLLGPQGTGLLLCTRHPEPLLYGGTGSDSKLQTMPDYLPEGGEAGTVNVPGIAGLEAGLAWLQETGMDKIAHREHIHAARCGQKLREMGFRVFSGEHQGGTVSFVPPGDCEEVAQRLAKAGIAVRSGLHCAPLAHQSAGTLDTGTVRLSFGIDACREQTEAFLKEIRKIFMNCYCHRGAHPL